MANTARKFGFIPIAKLDGSVIPVRRFWVSSSSSTAMFVGDLVSKINAGYVTPSTADDATIVVGAVVAVYDSNGIPCGHPGSSVSTKYLTASVEGYADVALFLADAVFEVATVEADLAQTCVFASANHVAGTGLTTTGISQHYLGSVTTGAAQCQIIGKSDRPNNAWGTYVVVYVVPCESMWRAAGAGT